MRTIPSDDLRQRSIERLIFALDIGADLTETLSWVDRLRKHVGLFKVGKESFTLHGPEIVRQITRRGGKVFLDLKFHDIPNTVARAAEGVVGLNVSMFNIHALGGREMMGQTVAAVRRLSETLRQPMPAVLAVTVLTSLNDEDLRLQGFQCSAQELTLTLCRIAQDAGVTGVVASAQDIVAIREACGPDFLIVTPGIRDADQDRGDDQKRTLTAEEAIRRGADYLVVGRPIRMADDVTGAAERMIERISAGLQMREQQKGG